MKQKYRTNLEWLQSWYFAQIKDNQKDAIIFDTLDNPGWAFFVKLNGTNLDGEKFVEISSSINSDDWLMCRVRDTRFESACGPFKLSEVLTIFRKWVEGVASDAIESPAQFTNKAREKDQAIDVGDDFLWLQDWYCYYCDGDWEHEYGVRIHTTEEGGWSLQIDLETTELEGLNFEKVDLAGLRKSDWIFCEVVNNKFIAKCGPFNLCKLLISFREWAESRGQKVNTTQLFL